ncbi:MAG: hypothetical protein VYC34_08725, partial [Planctomycetota bacterium]|nr:hypothetical protein [Planctomycetota bacterium]
MQTRLPRAESLTDVVAVDEEPAGALPPSPIIVIGCLIAPAAHCALVVSTLMTIRGPAGAGLGLDVIFIAASRVWIWWLPLLLLPLIEARLADHTRRRTRNHLAQLPPPATDADLAWRLRSAARSAARRTTPLDTTAWRRRFADRAASPSTITFARAWPRAPLREAVGEQVTLGLRRPPGAQQRRA